MMKQITLLLVTFLLVACSSNPMGTISVRSVNQTGSLESPLVNSSHLINDENIIFKTEDDGSTDGDDVYAIYLTDSYLKYLSDWWGINEVIFVVEFTEAVTGNREADTTTKILGPYDSLADGIKAPFLNKALYGPKKMESDLLTMKIKVYEYDLDESDQSSAMLEFITSAAESFSLSNPITLGEIKVAKEIANTLLLANENDLVMNLDVDFVAGNANYASSNHSNVLPLKSGQVVIVKQEGCSVATCYDYFSKGGSNLPGLIPDFFMLIPTTLNRAFIDTPDGSSLEEFKDKNLKVTKAGLTEFDDNGASKGLYKDKTWLRLNIVKGGDASQWLARKALYPSAEEIEKLLKNPNSFKRENLENIIQGLSDAQKSIIDATASVKMTSLKSHNGIHFIDQKQPDTSSSLCIKYPDNVDITNVSLIAKNSNLTTQASLLSQAKGASCYQLTPAEGKSAFTSDSKPSSASFLVNYNINGSDKVKSIPISISTQISESDFSLQCILNDTTTPSNYQIKITDGNNKSKQITSLSMSGHDTLFSMDNNEISLVGVFTATGPQTISINGVLDGQFKKTISCIDEPET
ncbi:hypothetical protein [Marinomonas posidonica]|nr:hypothetical protein [Marinomonas posidonica]